MAGKRVIIIGAGLTGLSAGCYAQLNGYQSHIFEHHAKPGGVAAAWMRKGYTIDGGIHFIMGYKPGSAIYELYRELGAGAASTVDMVTYGRFIDEASGRSAEVTQDLERLAADWKALSPIDARVIDEFINGARAMQGIGMSGMGTSKPPELLSRLDQLQEMWQMRGLLRYFSGDFAKPLADYALGIRDPWLRDCVRNLFEPESPVWFVLMLLGLLADGQLGFLEGGCPSFVRLMEKRYNDLGGQVTYEATVDEILVENDRAAGIRLTDGSEHRSDVVISAADGYSTIFKMLGGRYVNAKIKARYAIWKLCRPLMTISYGVARQFPNDPALSIITLEHPIDIQGQPTKGVFVRIFNYSSQFAPPGKTALQVGFETEWDYWDKLQRDDRTRYNAEKQRIAADVLERLEAHYPGLSSQVEVTDVATPYTTWRYTLNHRGAWGGWLPTAEVLMKRVERTLPGLSGFYMAGQWVIPGGGVPTCLYSGRHAVQLLCHQDKKPFSAAAS